MEYRDYAGLIYSLDSKAWVISRVPKDERPIRMQSVLAHLDEGINLIVSSCGLRYGHHCEEWDFMYITEVDEEIQACPAYLEAIRTKKICPDCKKPLSQMCLYRCSDCGGPACLGVCLGAGIE